MFLQPFMINLETQEVNLYLAADPEIRTGFLVDAGGYVPDLIEAVQANQLNISHILLTHLHWDHVDALRHYLNAWPDALIIAPESAGWPSREQLVRDGSEFHAGSFPFEVFGTAGHTLESVCYYCEPAGLLFSGDTLFAGSVGGTGGGDEHQAMLQNIRTKILTLPGDTEVLPGHGPITTVAIEKQANPFLRPGFNRA